MSTAVAQYRRCARRRRMRSMQSTPCVRRSQSARSRRRTKDPQTRRASTTHAPRTCRSRPHRSPPSQRACRRNAAKRRMSSTRGLCCSSPSLLLHLLCFHHRKRSRRSTRSGRRSRRRTLRPTRCANWVRWNRPADTTRAASSSHSRSRPHPSNWQGCPHSRPSPSYPCGGPQSQPHHAAHDATSTPTPWARGTRAARHR